MAEVKQPLPKMSLFRIVLLGGLLSAAVAMLLIPKGENKNINQDSLDERIIPILTAEIKSNYEGTFEIKRTYNDSCPSLSEQLWRQYLLFEKQKGFFSPLTIDSYCVQYDNNNEDLVVDIKKIN